jgi:hypothetical protein
VGIAVAAGVVMGVVVEVSAVSAGCPVVVKSESIRNVPASPVGSLGAIVSDNSAAA